MHHRFFSAILIAFLAVLCSPDLIRGQSTDSLLYLIDNDLVQDDFEKYEILCQVISELFEAEPKIRYSEQAIALAEKLDILPALPYLTKGEGYLDFDYLAVDSDIVQNRAKALECFIQAASYAEQNGEWDYLGRAYLLMAETYNSQGHPENERRYLEQAMEVFESEKDTFNLAYAMHNLG